MKVGVAASGPTFDDNVDEQFGRCPRFLLVDSDTMAFEDLPNPGGDMPGGAGSAAVQLLIDHGAQLVLAKRFGPKAEQALKAAGVPYKTASGRIRDAVAGNR